MDFFTQPQFVILKRCNIFKTLTKNWINVKVLYIDVFFILISGIAHLLNQRLSDLDQNSTWSGWNQKVIKVQFILLLVYYKSYLNSENNHFPLCLIFLVLMTWGLYDQDTHTALLMGLRIHWLYSLPRSYVPLQKQGECPGYVTKLHQMVRLQFWSFGECGVHLHYYYSQVYYDPKL